MNWLVDVPHGPAVSHCFFILGVPHCPSVVVIQAHLMHSANNIISLWSKLKSLDSIVSP